MRRFHDRHFLWLPLERKQIHTIRRHEQRPSKVHQRNQYRDVSHRNRNGSRRNAEELHHSAAVRRGGMAGGTAIDGLVYSERSKYRGLLFLRNLADLRLEGVARIWRE